MTESPALSLCPPAFFLPPPPSPSLSHHTQKVRTNLPSKHTNAQTHMPMHSSIDRFCKIHSFKPCQRFSNRWCFCAYVCVGRGGGAVRAQNLQTVHGTTHVEGFAIISQIRYFGSIHSALLSLQKLWTLPCGGHMVQGK